VVAGSSSWAANRFLGFNGNSDLALNAVNWLSSDEDLISIRPKQQEDRRITMTRAQLNLVRGTSQFVLPLIVIITGTLVWWKRDKTLMNFRGLIVAVVVLGALGGVLYWSQHRKPPEEVPLPASTAPVILKVNAADVTQLTIKQKTPVTLKKADGKWQITQPAPYPADQEAVAGVLSTLSG
jgi:hypothetical protein